MTGKIIIFISSLILFFSLIFSFTTNTQAAGQCANWCHCGCDRDLLASTGGCYSHCDCCDGKCIISPFTCNSTGDCDPGFFVCNRNGGSCCPIGSIPAGGGDEASGGASCTETAPSGLLATRVSPTSATLNWTPGIPGGSAPYQALWVSTNPDPFVGCAGSAGGTATCPVRHDADTVPLDSDQSSYNVVDLLSPNTIYYWEVMNFQDSSCYQSALEAYASSCDLSPSSSTIVNGTTRTVNSIIASGNGIGRVEYISGSPAVFSATSPDPSYPYSTSVTGLSVGSGILTANVKSAVTPANTICTATANVNVIPPAPWWQVIDSDINSTGDLNSDVPEGSYYFGLEGSGGYPGVPSYTSSSNLTSTNVSTLGWIADSDNLDQKIYDYQFFANQIPADTVITTVPSESVDGSFFESGGTMSGGYYWYKYDGSGSGLDLTLNSAMNLGSRKVILFIDSANFNINAPINLTDGQGFFLVITGIGAGGTKGNIIVDPAVGGGAGPNLEGIYEADNQFRTGDGNLQLQIRGSVTAYGGIDMKRNLGDALNGTSPSEVFEFAPDQIMLFPSAAIGSRKISWKEVAP